MSYRKVLVSSSSLQDDTIDIQPGIVSITVCAAMCIGLQNCKTFKYYGSDQNCRRLQGELFASTDSIDGEVVLMLKGINATIPVPSEFDLTQATCQTSTTIGSYVCENALDASSALDWIAQGEGIGGWYEITFPGGSPVYVSKVAVSNRKKEGRIINLADNIVIKFNGFYHYYNIIAAKSCARLIEIRFSGGETTDLELPDLSGVLAEKEIDPTIETSTLRLTFVTVWTPSGNYNHGFNGIKVWIIGQ